VSLIKIKIKRIKTNKILNERKRKENERVLEPKFQIKSNSSSLSNDEDSDTNDIEFENQLFFQKRANILINFVLTSALDRHNVCYKNATFVLTVAQSIEQDFTDISLNRESNRIRRARCHKKKKKILQI
jgi:predicted naringenin-chalcone synthase